MDLLAFARTHCPAGIPFVDQTSQVRQRPDASNVVCFVVGWKSRCEAPGSTELLEALLQHGYPITHTAVTNSFFTGDTDLLMRYGAEICSVDEFVHFPHLGKRAIRRL